MTNPIDGGPKRVRKLPSVDRLLQQTPLHRIFRRVGRTPVVHSVRSRLADFRLQMRQRARHFPLLPVAKIPAQIAHILLADDRTLVRPVVNGTGILLHSSLGSVPLAEYVVEKLAEVARNYATLAVDLESAESSDLGATMEDRLCQFTGSEAAWVVSSNAAATYLTVAACASGREVVVSRGELLEFETGVRLPDILAASGARLREVGTVNRTEIADYRTALQDHTGAILRIGKGSGCTTGSNTRPSLAELGDLARHHGIALIEDLGFAASLNISRVREHGESTIARHTRRGADLVILSGDSLLGGPSCGIIVGKKALVQQVVSHPMARALRVEKLAFAALSATLEMVTDSENAIRGVPLYQFLSTPTANLKQRAERLALQLSACGAVKSAEALPSEACMRQQPNPEQRIESWCVALAPSDGSLSQFAKSLRAGTPSVVGQIHEQRLRVDLRTVSPRQDQEIVAAVSRLGS